MHPNSIANLRPAWKPGQKPNPTGVNGQRRIDKALEMAQNATPKAARLIVRAISDADLPMSTRLRCAEYILDKVLPSQKGAELQITGGAEFLELRFVSPTAETPSAKHQEITTTYEIEEAETHNPAHNGVEPEDEPSL